MSADKPLTHKQAADAERRAEVVVRRLNELLDMPEIRDLINEVAIREGCGSNLRLTRSGLVEWVAPSQYMDLDGFHSGDSSVEPSAHLVLKYGITVAQIDRLAARLKAK